MKSRTFFRLLTIGASAVSTPYLIKKNIEFDGALEKQEAAIKNQKKEEKNEVLQIKKSLAAPKQARKRRKLRKRKKKWLIGILVPSITTITIIIVAAIAYIRPYLAHLSYAPTGDPTTPETLRTKLKYENNEKIKGSRPWLHGNPEEIKGTHMYDRDRNLVFLSRWYQKNPLAFFERERPTLDQFVSIIRHSSLGLDSKDDFEHGVSRLYMHNTHYQDYTLGEKMLEGVLCDCKKNEDRAFLGQLVNYLMRSNIRISRLYAWHFSRCLASVRDTERDMFNDTGVKVEKLDVNQFMSGIQEIPPALSRYLKRQARVIGYSVEKGTEQHMYDLRVVKKKIMEYNSLVTKGFCRKNKVEQEPIKKIITKYYDTSWIAVASRPKRHRSRHWTIVD